MNQRSMPLCALSTWLRCLAIWVTLCWGAGPASALTAEEATRVGGDLSAASELVEAVTQRMANFRASLAAVADAAPRVGTDLSQALTTVQVAKGQRQLGDTGLKMLLCIAFMVVLVSIYAITTRRVRAWCRDNRIPARGATGLILLDLGRWAVFASAAYLSIRFFFATDDTHALMFVAVMSGIWRWMLLRVLLDVALRPRAPRYRLVAMSDADAWFIRRTVSAGAFVGLMGISIMPVLLRAGLPIPSGQVIVLLQGVVVAAACGLALWRYSRSAAAALVARQRKFWLWTGIIAIPLLWITWCFSVLVLDFSLYHSLVYTVRITMAAYLVHALLDLSAGQHWWLKFAQHAINAAAVLAISILLVDLWAVERLHLIPPATWLPIQHSLVTTAITLFLGFVAWRYLDLWTEQRLRAASSGMPGMDEDIVPEPASRLTTSLPLVRVLVGVGIVLAVAFLALSELGANLNTLIAGASVFGLALSFGSQALVRDIVSGVFFMSDDAFRVGEYIDTGKLKGTVERVTLRSVRLRHQNGQVHTIPFGQLNAITNFSREWQTVKFNLRLARDTDLEKTRKVVKRIGQEMLEDAEIGKEFLLPLKLQGMAEIADTALIVRLKFTVRPSNPSVVQREALKRLYRRFAEEDIRFADGTITVRPGDAPDVSPSHAGAAAAAVATMAATAAALPAGS